MAVFHCRGSVVGGQNQRRNYRRKLWERIVFQLPSIFSLANLLLVWGGGWGVKVQVGILETHHPPSREGNLDDQDDMTYTLGLALRTCHMPSLRPSWRYNIGENWGPFKVTKGGYTDDSDGMENSSVKLKVNQCIVTSTFKRSLCNMFFSTCKISFVHQKSINLFHKKYRNRNHHQSKSPPSLGTL